MCHMKSFYYNRIYARIAYNAVYSDTTLRNF